MEPIAVCDVNQENGTLQCHDLLADRTLRAHRRSIDAALCYPASLATATPQAITRLD